MNLKQFKRTIGYSAWLGNRRRLDELLGRKDMYENQIKKRFGDWKECEKCLASIDEEIAKVRQKISEEDS